MRTKLIPTYQALRTPRRMVRGPTTIRNKHLFPTQPHLNPQISEKPRLRYQFHCNPSKHPSRRQMDTLLVLQRISLPRTLMIIHRNSAHQCMIRHRKLPRKQHNTLTMPCTKHNLPSARHKLRHNSRPIRRLVTPHRRAEHRSHLLPIHRTLCSRLSNRPPSRRNHFRPH